jgi:serine/threonine protein kinase
MAQAQPPGSGSDPAGRSAPIPFAAEAAAETSPPPSMPGAGSRSAALTSPDDLHPGARIGKYQIVRLLGRGGMGAVFEAIDVALHRPVALKILPREFSENDEALKRFIREARLAARLNHPNAVGVYDVGKKGTIYYIAMELVRGASGQELLESTTLGWREATRWIADGCRALSAAHQAGLIHRDVKPSNMLKSADSGAIKISDFGLAKPTDSAKKALTLTQKDAFIGTPLFMSPEQCRNDRVDGRSDIYSLGATYYTLLTGRPPYASGTALQILFAHCSAPIPDARDIAAADVPDGCAVIVKKAMAKDPADRYQRADDMLADLQRVLDGEAIDADPTLAAMSALIPNASASADVAPAPPMAWQSIRGSAAASERQWWSVGIIAGAIVLVGGGILAVLIARSGSGERDARPIAPTAQVAAIAPAAKAPHRAAEAPTTPQPPPVQQRVTSPPAQGASQVALATPATQPVTMAQPEPTPKPTSPQPSTAPAPTPQPQEAPPVAQAPPPPPVEEQPIPDLPDTVANRPIRAYFQARQWAQKAKVSGNVAQIERGARALILWHDFFARSPHAEHAPYAEESKKLAEQYSLGITDKPRVQVTATAGLPLPPTPPAKPREEEPPRKPQQRPPQRRPAR